MKNISLRRGQRGFSLLPIALTVLMIGYLSLQFVPMMGRMQFYLYRTATVTGINELASASKNYYVDASGGSPSWPATAQTLIDGGYIGNFENRNGFGYPYTFEVNLNTFIISTRASDNIQAQEVASHFGGLAVVEDETVKVSWSIPGREASYDALLPRDGSRDVFGTITHRAGGAAGLVLNGNDIDSVGQLDATGSITVRNASLTGLINSDVGAIDVLTVNDLRITP